MRVSGVILATALALGAAGRASAQSATAQVAFAPVSSTAAVGTSVAVDVTVADVAGTGLGGYNVTMSFNPAVVRLDSFADSGFVRSGQLIVICGPAQIDNVVGTAQAICTPFQLFGAPGVTTTSPVALLHASFTALAPGTSPLSLDGSALNDPTGAAMTATFGSGSITVSAPAQATPSPQPTATPPASATAQPTMTPQASATVQPSPTPTLVSVVSAATAPALNLAPKAPTAGTGEGAARSPGPLSATIIAATLVSLLLLGASSALMLRQRTGR